IASRSRRTRGPAGSTAARRSPPSRRARRGRPRRTARSARGGPCSRGLPTRVIPLNSLLVESGRRDIATLDRCGGDLALDFANTLGGLREGPWDDEWLHGYDDLADWARHAGALAPTDAAALRRRAAAHPRAAAAAYARAIALREKIHRGRAAGPARAAAAAYARAIALREQSHRVMAAVAAGDAPAAADLDALRAAYAGAVAHAALTTRGDRADFSWSGDGLDRPLWPVALAAVDLLRSDRLARLKQCRNCRWLFLDASKNASRRWCSMAHCGTGAKVAATRARRRTARRRP